MVYDHRQWSMLTVAVGVIAAVVLLATALATHGTGIIAIFVGLVTLSFARLDTHVDDDGITWSFLFGVPCGHCDWRDLAAAERVTTRWTEGFGIHWTIAHGWLWNAAGFDGVELFKENGTRVTIGTDDAPGLLAAIRAHQQ